MKHLKSYENSILYKNGDFIKIYKPTLSKAKDIHDVVKVIEIDSFGDNLGYISYKVEAISFDLNKLINFFIQQKIILRKATPDEIKQYDEYCINLTSNKYNL
jgi:hypothetical protein